MQNNNSNGRRVSALMGLTVLILLGMALFGLHERPGPAQAAEGWQEIVRVSATAAQWKRVSYNAYDRHCGAWFCSYTPTTGDNAFWWTPDYTPQGTWGHGSSWWDSNWPYWGYHPIPAIGKHAYRAENDNDDYTVDLARQTFTIPAGHRVVAGRMEVFSDNVGQYYLNGVAVPVGGHWGRADLPAHVIAALHSGTNLLAAAAHNEEQMMGLQYRLEVDLVYDPQVALSLANPAGEPVTRPVSGTAFSTYWGWITSYTHDFWGNVSAHTAAPPDLGTYSYQGVAVDLADNDVVLWDQSSISEQSGTGYAWEDDADNDGDIDVYVGWLGAISSSETVDLVIATQTPTPTPSPTPTPTPTPIVGELEIEDTYSDGKYVYALLYNSGITTTYARIEVQTQGTWDQGFAEEEPLLPVIGHQERTCVRLEPIPVVPFQEYTTTVAAVATDMQATRLAPQVDGIEFTNVADGVHVNGVVHNQYDQLVEYIRVVTTLYQGDGRHILNCGYDLSLPLQLEPGAQGGFHTFFPTSEISGTCTGAETQSTARLPQ
ncbi:MAG: hypothetical protein U9Q70_06540 [Chloroflexota bacterium]|nr:hypothetical protein [Chloroflexota bacterium]